MTQPERGKKITVRDDSSAKKKLLKGWGITSLLKYISQTYMCLQNKLQLQNNYWDTFKALQPPVSCRRRGQDGFWAQPPLAAGLDIVQSELLLHVSFRHLSKRVTLFLHQSEDGSQLLSLNPVRKKRRSRNSQSRSKNTAVKWNPEPKAGHSTNLTGCRKSVRVR